MDNEVVNFWLEVAENQIAAEAALEEVPKHLALIRLMRYNEEFNEYL